MSKSSWDTAVFIFVIIFAAIGGGFIFTSAGSGALGAILAFGLGVVSALLKDVITDLCYRHWPDKESD